MKFVVALLGTVMVSSEDGSAGVSEVIEEHLDEVMDELLKLGAPDATIDLELGEPIQVRFSVLVDAPDPIKAIEVASGFIRSSIHAAGGATPDWPGTDGRAWSVRLVGVESNELVDA